MIFFGQILANALMLGAIYALAAVAYTLVYGVVRLINFAFGELFMIGAYATISLMLPSVALFGYDVWMPNLPLVLAAPGGIACAVMLGVLIERVAYRPLRFAPRLAPLITAIAMSILLQSVAQAVWGPEELGLPDIALVNLPPIVLFGGIYVTALELVIVAVAITTMIGLMYLVHRTRFGQAIRAVASDTDAAYIIGIPVNRVIALTFALGTALAALAGILYCLEYGFAHPMMGFLPGLKALVAAVLGGVGSIGGAALGGVLLALFQTFGAGYLPSGSAYRDVIGFALLILFLYFRPHGLFGKPEVGDHSDGSLVGGKQQGLPVMIRRARDFIHGVLPNSFFRHLVFILIAIGLSYFITSNFWLRTLSVALVYAMLATGLNVVVGFAGLLDLGFVAFWAVGAYFSAILYVLVLEETYGIDPGAVWWLFYINFLGAGAMAALFGVFIGYPTLRLRGDYLAIMTLGFGEIIRIVATNWVGLTRGPMGIRDIPEPMLAGYALDSPRALFLMALGLSVVCVFLVTRVVRSHIGRAWVSIRDNEYAAEAMGIDTRRYKLLAYASGAFIGGICGVFYAHFQQYVNPLNFILFDNVLILMMVVLGGLGTIVGPFLGAFVWIIFLQVLQAWPFIQANPETRYGLLAIMLIVLMLYRPQGLLAFARPSLVNRG